MNFIIWHNPRCSKSRQTLAILKEKGIEADIVLYLENPPTSLQIQNVLDLLKFKPRDLMRKKESIYTKLNLGDEALSSDFLIEKMVENPALIERPIVISGNQAVLGRPPENVMNLLS